MIKIAIPSDFSDNAWNAMQYAAQLFEHEVCTFVLLNAFNSAPTNVQAVAVDYYEPLTRASKKQLDVLYEKFRMLNHHPKTTIESQSSFGDLVWVLKEMTLEEDFDYIVMGTKGASGLAEFFIGSNTASVIAEASCPVICVPENATFSKPKRILFASDNNDFADSNILNPLKLIADKFNSEILILILRNQNTEPVSVQDAKQELEAEQILKDTEHDIFIRNDENIEMGIRDFAHDKKVDIIAMVKRKHSLWQSIFNSSITKKMAFHTDIPLLVIHESK